MKSLDLDKPADARFFLRGVRVQGNAIEWVMLDNKKKLLIDDMTDAQAVRYAKDIYFDFCGGVEGEGGVVDLESSGALQ